MVFASAITFFEIAQKTRDGRWPEMAPHVDRLAELLESQRAKALPLDPAECLSAGLMAWDHRDPFDRLLAATALRRRMALLSAGAVFDGVVARIW